MIFFNINLILGKCKLRDHSFLAPFFLRGKTDFQNNDKHIFQQSKYHKSEGFLQQQSDIHIHQPAFTNSKLTIETVEQGVKYVHS